MKSAIFICFLTLFISVNNSQAQLLSFTKKNKTDDHLKYSDYTPQRSKKEERALKKEMQRQKALSYTPKKVKSEKNNKERKEAKYNMLRLKRAQFGKNTSNAKETKTLRKDVKRKYDRQERKRQNKVLKAQRNYGTKQSRNSFRTDKSDKWILENDEEKKPLIRIKNPFKKNS